jgi:uncharacterized membrane protein
MAIHDRIERSDFVDDIGIARALHVLAILHWIGGVAFFTSIALPAIRRSAEPSQRLFEFENIERRFSLQAKFSVAIAGLSGFYMTYRLDAWDRFVDPHYWWMPAMVLVWAIFTFLLFVAEPLFLHAWYHHRAERDPDGTLVFLQRAHWILVCLSLITIVGAVLGAHGTI